MTASHSPSYSANDYAKALMGGPEPHSERLPWLEDQFLKFFIHYDCCRAFAASRAAFFNNAGPADIGQLGFILASATAAINNVSEVMYLGSPSWSVKLRAARDELTRDQFAARAVVANGAYLAAVITRHRPPIAQAELFGMALQISNDPSMDAITFGAREVTVDEATGRQVYGTGAEIIIGARYHLAPDHIFGLD